MTDLRLRTLQDLASRERASLRRDLQRGIPSPNADEAALAVRSAVDLLQRQWVDVALVLALLVGALVLAGAAPSLVPGLLVGAAATAVSGGRRRAALRQGLRANLEVVAGRTADGPPDPAAAERLLRIVEREGWLRGCFREQAPGTGAPAERVPQAGGRSA